MHDAAVGTLLVSEPTLENAQSLEKRIAFLLAEIIPGMVNTGS
jgi:hypothetical protein